MYILSEMKKTLEIKLLKIMLKLGQNKLIFCLTSDGEIYLFFYFCHVVGFLERLIFSFLYLGFLYQNLIELACLYMLTFPKQSSILL